MGLLRNFFSTSKKQTKTADTAFTAKTAQPTPNGTSSGGLHIPGGGTGNKAGRRWLSPAVADAILSFFLLLAVVVACYTGFAYHLPAGASRAVELTVRYSDVQIFAARAGLTVEEALLFLKKRGVTSVGVAEYTLWDLRRDPESYVLSNLELAGELALNPALSPYRDFLETRAREAGFSFGDYLVFMPAGPWAEQVGEHLQALYAVEGGELFRLTAHHRGEKVLYLLQGVHYDHLPPLSLGAKPARLEQVAAAGLLINPYLSPRSVETPAMAEQMLAVYERHPLSAAVFEGGAIPGYPGALPEWADALQARGIPAVLYEYHRFPRGMKELAPLLDHSLIVMRPGSILDEPRAALSGLRERRVQMLELDLRELASRSNGAALQEAADARLTKLAAALQENGYALGQARPLKPFHGHFLLYFFMGAGVLALALFLLQFFRPLRPVSLLLAFGFGLAALALFLKTRFLFTQQALALLAAVLFPYYGALYLLTRPLAAVASDFSSGATLPRASSPALSCRQRPHRGERGGGASLSSGHAPLDMGLLWRCLASVFLLFLFSLAGGLLVHGLLTTPPFFHGLELFRGVKAMYILPLVLSGLTALVLMAGFSGHAAHSIAAQTQAAGGSVPPAGSCVSDSTGTASPSRAGLSMHKMPFFPLQFPAEQRQAFFSTLRRLLRRTLTLGDLLLLGLLLCIAFIYLTRTGHVRSIVPLEGTLRNILEQSLGARPRFKEFVLGYPLALCGLYLAAEFFGRGKAACAANIFSKNKADHPAIICAGEKDSPACLPAAVDAAQLAGNPTGDEDKEACSQPAKYTKGVEGPGRTNFSGNKKEYRQNKVCRYLVFGALFGGALVPVSVVNTFAHTLAPLHLSLLRSFHGFWLGCLAGLLFILCWEKIIFPLFFSQK